MNNTSLGKRGEDIAEKFLQDRGFKILDRNFQNKFGEIDLVAVDEDTLVFVEVKTRYSDKFGKPEEAVTPRKVRKIIKAGQYYRNFKKDLDLPELERIDVVALGLKADGEIKRIELIENVTG